MTPAHSTPNAHRAAKVAAMIANCDFRTAISKYTTGDKGQWVITVGESSWQRHMIVKETKRHSATLAILSADQSSRSVIDLDTSKVEQEISLKDLIASGYTGVKDFLNMKKAA